MGGGGFASHAMNVVKANRALLKKRKRFSKTDLLKYSGKTQIKKKTTTPGQMRAVRLQMLANRRNEIKVWVISIFMFIVILAILYFWIVD